MYRILMKTTLQLTENLVPEKIKPRIFIILYIINLCHLLFTTVFIDTFFKCIFCIMKGMFKQ